MLRGRALIVLPVALLAAVAAIRAMTFVAPSDHPLRRLTPLFSGHPKALTDRAMGEIGAAAAKGAAVPQSARQDIAAVARKAPLAPEPFLVAGTLAQMAGDGARAEVLFLAARERDPRSPAARYFLADRYLKTNRILPGLIEAGALSRVAPQASAPLIPALAAYAATPGALGELRRFFRTAPQTRDLTLALLAGDPRNASLILALAATPTPGAKPPDWQASLVRSMVTAGDYAGAEAMWSRISGVANRGLLYNPQFRDNAGPPPFNWQLSSGNGGVAEASGGGGLDVIYYGRDEVSLAGQLVRLGAGRYRLAMRIDAPTSAAGVEWSIGCVGGNASLMALPLEAAQKGTLAGMFAVPPAACPAQWLELRGKPTDASQTAQVTISNLSLTPAVAP
jgi:hypothetical protein